MCRSRFHRNVFIGSNRISLDWCHYDAIEARGLDPSLGQTCSRMLPNSRWSVDILGRRNESKNIINCYFCWLSNTISGFWRTFARCRLVSKRWYVDVVIMFQFFSTIFSLLLSSKIWTQSWSEWGLYKVILWLLIYHFTSSRHE